MTQMSLKQWLKKSLMILAGAGLGFAYYYFIGCTSGGCPISSNPWISTGYGALIASILAWGNGASKNQVKSSDQTPNDLH
ncbi:DUF6132 family protein [candidate division KSB1 bacterium]|nr:DUF6132 family protein [candidate division KSB1 bacterium]